MEGSKKNSGKFVTCCCKYNIFAVTFIAFGIPLIFYLPEFVNNMIMHNLELRYDSRTFPEWKKPSVPLYLDIYIFNWTNPDDINNSSIKPNFQQIGPYRFREQPDKHNISFSEDGLTLKYRKSSMYHFDADASDGTLEDVVNAVNVVAISAAEKLSSLVWYKRYGATVVLSSQNIYVTKNVGELLFDGYEDNLLETAKMWGASTYGFERGGYFVNRNSTDQATGTYEVFTGLGDISRLDQIVTYNDLPKFPYHRGDCKELKGSAGELFPKSPIDKPLYLFMPDMCRSLSYDYEKDIINHDIRGNRFVASLRNIDNGDKFSENKCYNSGNWPSGTMNVSVCNYGAPMFISYPHFYLANSTYLDAIEGLAPNKEKHESFITLEPKTGITLEVTARFQTNVRLRPFKEVSMYRNFPSIMMPLFYVEQKFVMDEEKSSELRIGLLMLGGSRYVGFLLIFIGAFIFILKPIRYYCCALERMRKDEIIFATSKDVKEMFPLVK